MSDTWNVRDCYGSGMSDNSAAFQERAFTTVTSPPGSSTERVSVIVGARNYGRFLAACLHSIYAQTIPPTEVIYADDGSDDDSVAIARALEPHGLKILALPFQGVAAVRNTGTQAATGDLLLFVDGDNLLAPDFLERQLEALTAGTAFTYGSKHYFGRSEGLWEPRDWDRDRLWVENFVDTSALVRREWFEAIGGWRETSAGTLWDWDLLAAREPVRSRPSVRREAFLPASRREPEVRVDATRRHQIGTLRGVIRRSAARVAVIMAFSGRLPRLLPRWLDAVAATSASAPDAASPELIVLDDSTQGFLALAGADLGRLERHFTAVKVLRVHEGKSWRERRPDRTATARFLTGAYHRAGQETEAEVLWYIEDDIIVPPDSYDRLLHLLLDGEEPARPSRGCTAAATSLVSC